MAHRVFLNVFVKKDVISNLLHRNKQPRQKQQPPRQRRQQQQQPPRQQQVWQQL